MTITDSNVKILYDLSDASWQPDERAICNIIFSECHIVKTVFDTAKQRFVSLYAISVENENTENYTVIGENILNDASGIRQNCFVSVLKTLLVPNALFDERNIKSLFENQHHLEPGEDLLTCSLKMIEARMIFACAEPYINFQKRTSSSLFPVDAAWLDNLYVKHKTQEGIHLHCNISDGFIGIAVFKDGALRFYNTFETANAEEILYFVMFVSEQIGINPQKDQYHYSGYMYIGDPVQT